MRQCYDRGASALHLWCVCNILPLKKGAYFCFSAQTWFKRHARWLDIDAINYATKYNFPPATKSSLMSMYLN